MMTSVAVLVFACTLVELSAKRKLAETLQQLKRKREQQVVTWRRSYFKEHRKEKKMREGERQDRVVIGRGERKRGWERYA